MDVFKRAVSGERFDAPDPRGDAGFADNFKKSDIAGFGSMGTTAKFFAEIRQRDHPHTIAVLFFKKCGGAGFESVFSFHFIGMRGDIFADTTIHKRFDLSQGGAIHQGKVGKIKSQSIRCHQRTGLLDMLTENLAQNGMQNVSGRVVQSGCRAFGPINLQGNFLAGFYFSE